MSFERGLRLKNDKLHICLENSDRAKMEVVLYSADKKELKRVELIKANRLGSLVFTDLDVNDLVGKSDELLYRILRNGEVTADPYMTGYTGKHEFGRPVDPKEVYYTVSDNSYDWQDDKAPNHEFNETLMYLMHVRGFTKHASSKVKGRGCYLGVTEKIPHLTNLGINCIEMMPVNELDVNRNITIDPTDKAKKVNYWGFQKGFYYCVNKAMAYDDDAAAEFKDMVKALHKAEIEVILQFYFPDDVRRGDIPEILTFWKTEYHVDGFHLKGDNLPKKILNEMPELKDCKFIYDYVDDYELDPADDIKRIASYQDDYMYDMRRFLKGDEGVTDIALRLMRENPKGKGVIRFFTNYYGFTLKDLVSYERKHNEDNGENNADGADFNLSWNCGAEGVSRKKAINTLRDRQMKNALCLMAFTQGTPLLLMGDEFGNSQKGNNNPYCQDNEVTWLNWNNLNSNKEYFDFVKSIFEYRAGHSCIHPKDALRLMDYASCGYPDLSYHGAEAWKPDLFSYNRHVGLLFAGRYSNENDKFIYMAVNMHWEKHDFALPNIPNGLKWKIKYDTFSEVSNRQLTEAEKEAGKVSLNPRSVIILESEGDVEPLKPIKRKKN